MTDEGRTSGNEPIEGQSAAEVARRIEALRAKAGVSTASSPPPSARSAAPAPTPSADSASPDRVTRRLETIAALRGPRKRDLAIGTLVGETRDRAERTQRRLGDLIELWEELVPADLLPHTTLGALRGGVLHVHVDSAPAVYELDRLLREGLMAELRRRYRSTLSRVRVTQSAAKA